MWYMSLIRAGPNLYVGIYFANQSLNKNIQMPLQINYKQFLKQFQRCTDHEKCKAIFKK